MSQTVFVSTTIPYVNSQPHVGFALELVQADAYASRDKPWENLKTAPERARSQVQSWLEELWGLNDWLGVFLPRTADRIHAQLKEIEVNHGHLFKRIDDRSRVTSV